MLMQRTIVGGVLSERDLLLQYTVGEFFNELSLFIHEVDLRNREMEKAGHG